MRSNRNRSQRWRLRSFLINNTNVWADRYHARKKREALLQSNGFNEVEIIRAVEQLDVYEETLVSEFEKFGTMQGYDAYQPGRGMLYHASKFLAERMAESLEEMLVNDLY